MPLEHVIRCAPRRDPRGGLEFELDGVARTATLRVDRLHARLVAELPDRALDLIDIAAFVYCADAMIARGGLSDPGMGRGWRRSLKFEVPVRKPEIWTDPDVVRALCETLNLLSDDFFEFAFTQHPDTAAGSPFLRLDDKPGFRPDEILMFSGGLDSLAGALDDLINQGRRVALISHQSSTKLQRVQADLVADLRKRAGPGRVMHVPITMTLKNGATRESTHRTRSFLFAALGMATAEAFGLNRVRFHENGVVSLSLPISGQAVGARVTRSTHPQALAGLGRLFSAVFARPIKVDNPFIWKTKTEIVGLIRDLGAADLLRMSRSCGDVRDMTRAHPNCGVCSQCIDRRFAMLALGAGDEDPIESYAVDPLAGPRPDVRDREMAVGYVRNARRFAAMTPTELLGEYGEVQRAIASLDMPTDMAADRLFQLLRRHGQAVTGVVRARLAKLLDGDDDDLAADSVLRLAGMDVLGGSTGEAGASRSGASSPVLALADTPVWSLTLSDKPAQVAIQGLGIMTGVDAQVLRTLAARHLEAAGAGRAFEDYPLTSAADLSADWGVDHEGVRKRIARLRGSLRKLAIAAGRSPPDENGIVETIPWRGYRLATEGVRVFMARGARRR
jgi:7-cyano-7-deazaguanine synthase in queuosine biosynthesis